MQKSSPGCFLQSVRFNKLIAAYEWERDHIPEKNVNYDELINAFKDVLNE